MTNDLKTELTLLADEEAPLSTIDISRAQQDGRRKMLTGRLAAAGTGVAVVAACGLAVGGLAGGGDGATTRPAASGGTAPAAKVPVAFTGTDPLSSHASFGQLPAGWQTGSIEDGPDYGNHIEAYSGTDKQTGPYANLEITGKERAAGTFDPYATSAPATVPGSPKAEYITIPARDKVYPTAQYGLQWQTPQGTWATLFVSHVGSKDANLALLDSLAAGVTLDETPVPLPLHIDGLSKDFPARSEELNVPGFAGKTFEVHKQEAPQQVASATAVEMNPLQQLKAGGLMVIPVGPPGAQRVLKVAKTQGADGSITTSREDIYGGKIVPFVPFTKLEGDQIVGNHNR